MKAILLTFCFLLFTSITYSQDILKLKRIDSLVNVINNLKAKIEKDTILNDLPYVGISVKTHLSMILDNDQLRKYVSTAHSVKLENDVSTETVTSSAFYYDQNVLIKVEEFAMQGDDIVHFDWYYSDDKCIYYTLQSERAGDRANLLLSMSKGLLTQTIKK